MNELVGAIFLTGAIILILWLVRNIILWYYRINDMFAETSEIKALHEQQIELQKEILELLKDQKKENKEKE